MKDSHWTAIYLALILTAFSFFMLGKVSEKDIPRCPEGVKLEGFGAYSQGHHSYYQCASTPVDAE